MPEVRETKLANGLKILSANTGGGMFAMRVVSRRVRCVSDERPAVSRA